MNSSLPCYKFFVDRMHRYYQGESEQQLIRISSLISIILLLSFSFFQKSIAQEVRFRRLGLKEGLSQSSVYGIIQDRRGFIWIATADGLNRYDGSEFRVYRHDPADSLSLNQNGIWTLGVDSLDNLWIGLMSRGLDYLNAVTGRVHHFQHHPDDTTTLSSNRVRVIHCDANGYVWVGTSDAGLNRIDARSLDLRRIPSTAGGGSGIRGKKIKAVIDDGSGWLLVATEDGGLTRLHPHTLKCTSIPINAKGSAIETIFLDSQDRLWIAFIEGGIWRSEIGWKEWISQHGGSKPALPAQPLTVDSPEARALRQSIVKTMVEDEEGNLWLGTFTQGLLRLNLKTWQIQHLTYQPFDSFSLSNNQIFSLFLDRSGILWVGTNGGSLNLMDDRLNRFQYFRLHPDPRLSLPDQMVRAIITDSSGAIWVGASHGGLARIDPASYMVRQIYRSPNPPQTPTSADVRSLLIDDGGYLWIGTYGGGLYRMLPPVSAFAQNPNTKATFEAYYPDAQRPSPGAEVWCLLQDHRGWLWMGTNDGLLRLNPHTRSWRVYAPQPDNPRSKGLAHSIVRTLWLDEGNHLWVGTYDGLHRLPLGGSEEEAGDFTRYHRDSSPTGLSSNAIGSLWEYPAGYLWVGTFGGGLNLLDLNRGIWRHWGAREGLPSDNILGIREDGLGHLWFSTTSGLCRISLSHVLPDTADPPQGSAHAKISEELRIFDEKDGLQSHEFNAGAVHRDLEGSLYFGGIRGFNRFHPGDIRTPDYPIPLVLTEILIFNESLLTDSLPEVLSRLYLSHRQNFFSISFAALDFHNPQSIRYKYRLKNFEDGWREIVGQNRASFTNVPPGRYIFEVMAQAGSGGWSEEPTRLHIIISPPFWKTLWFRLLILILIGLSLYGIHHYRLARERELQTVRARIAQDLHDEVASSLASIRLYSEVLEKQSEKDKVLAGQIHERIRMLAAEVNENISQIIWSVDPSHDRLEDLLTYLRDYARDACAAAGIKFTYHAPDLDGSISVLPQRRRAIYLVLKEGITNSLRHSHATEIKLSLTQYGAMVQFIVEDNGQGFHVQGDCKGRGLTNMRRRAEEIGADLQIMSAPQKGTMLRLQAKMT